MPNGPASFACDTELKKQCAALCYRKVAGQVQVLLITSRGTGRWILPKGWKMSGRPLYRAAAQEAWEEAGVNGTVKDKSLGAYPYLKLVEDGPDVPCVVKVYPIKVKSLSRDFPERGQRKRKWFSRKKAAERVDEPELAQILRNFVP